MSKFISKWYLLLHFLQLLAAINLLSLVYHDIHKHLHCNQQAGKPKTFSFRYASKGLFISDQMCPKTVVTSE